MIFPEKRYFLHLRPLENHEKFSSFPYYHLGHTDAHPNVRLTHESNREVALNMLLRPEADVNINPNE